MKISNGSSQVHIVSLKGDLYKKTLHLDEITEESVD